MPFINIKPTARSFLDMLFPAFCLSCEKEGSYLCAKCKLTMKRDEFQLCPTCGKKSPFGRTHPECRTDFGLDGLISAVPYKEPLSRKIVETLKYRMVTDMAPIMAEIMYEEILNLELVNHFKDFVIIPLPLHKSRLRWRGFNQSELITRPLAKHLDLLFRPDILMRIKKTKVQAELKDEERPLNVLNAFQALRDLSDQKFLVIDDVSTTRSTILQACQALKQAKAVEVWGIVFAQG